MAEETGTPHPQQMAFSDLERLRQLLLSCVTCCVGLTAIDLVFGRGSSLLGMALTLLGFGISWGVAQWGKVAIATQIYAAVALSGISHLVWVYGGTSSGLEPWLLLPFMGVLLTRGIRPAVPWALLALPVMAVIAHSPHPELEPWTRYFVATIYAVMLAAGLALFTRAKRLVASRLTASIEALNREVAQRSAAEARAVEAERAQAEFLATMSHEIRTPLAGMLSMTELLAQAELPAAQASQVGVLEQSGALLMRVVNEVLDLSKFRAGLIDMEPAPCQLGHLVQGSVALYRPMAQAKGLSVDVASYMGLPAWVMVDGARVQQVLGNLLRNAIQNTERGGVVVGMSWTDGFLELSITDSGPGISAEAQKRIFDRYGQREVSSEGAGLGLAIVWQISQAMGGGVRVNSTLGEGSTFLCRLEAPQCSPPISAKPAGPRKLLVVDDQQVNRDVLTMMLEARGHRVFSVGGGQEALELLRGGGLDLDLMICDLHMPEMTGWELVRSWREVEAIESLPHLPILGLTASILDGEHEKALASGMDRVQTKPLRVDDLDGLLTQLIA